jgi:hypothetical protein
MSYNHAYGQPQSNMQTTLPYPATQLVAAPMPVVRGNAPFLPNIQYLPPNLQQFLPLIVTDCIDAIQSKYQINALRVFMFNQMIQNGYNNVEFAGFVEGVTKLTPNPNAPLWSAPTSTPSS